MLRMIDNYDSFTLNLAQYLQALGAGVQLGGPEGARENRHAGIHVGAEGFWMAGRGRAGAGETWLGGRHAAEDRQLRQLHIQPRELTGGDGSGGVGGAQRRARRGCDREAGAGEERGLAGAVQAE